ncbi:MAG: hypothetical protein IJ087_14440 [Eggerthellaceae bacterium]|nr:hypothetical protein [Eggerthellaceae bacterium]
MYVFHKGPEVVHVVPDGHYSPGMEEAFGAEAEHVAEGESPPGYLEESLAAWQAHDGFLREGDIALSDAQDAVIEVAELAASNEVTLNDVIDAVVELASLIGGE